MIYHTHEGLTRLFQTPEFEETYKQYISTHSSIKEFQSFIDNIDINKKYFRLTMAKQGYRKRKHLQQNKLGDDTLALKDITSYLNKVTDKTAGSITSKIKERLIGKEYIQPMILESIITKCLLYPQYISTYLTLTETIYDKDPHLSTKFIKLTDSIYESLLNSEINTEESEYLQFCAKNKRLDKLIGHTQLICECEQRKFVSGRIHPTIQSFFELLTKEDDPNEKYKCVQCLYTLMKSLYGSSLLPQGYKTTIDDLIQTESSCKIKYKLMDIIDRR